MPESRNLRLGRRRNGVVTATPSEKPATALQPDVLLPSHPNRALRSLQTPLWDQADEKDPGEELPSSKVWKRNHSDPSARGELLLSCSYTKVTLQIRAPPAPRPLFDKKINCSGRQSPSLQRQPPTQHAGLLEHLNNVQVGARRGRQQIFAINQLSGLVYSLPKPTSGITGDEASFFPQPKTKSSNSVTDTVRCAQRLAEL